MSRLCLFALLVAAVAAGCHGYGASDQTDQGPCPEPVFPCYTEPDAECRIICWENLDSPTNQECQFQYFKNSKRVICFID